MKDLTSLFPVYISRLVAELAVPKWLVAFAIGVMEYVLPSIAPGVALATAGLVVVDTLSGIVAAKVGGQPITSAKLGRFLTKVFSYAVAVITIALSLNVLPNMRQFHAAAVTMVITGIAITETTSIFENLAVMGYMLPAPVRDLLNKAARKLAPERIQTPPPTDP